MSRIWPVFFVHEKFQTISGQINPTNTGHKKFQTNPGQIKQINSGHKKFQTYSGQINSTNSGHKKILDIFQILFLKMEIFKFKKNAKSTKLTSKTPTLRDK
jgi:hypothetical protein